MVEQYVEQYGEQRMPEETGTKSVPMLTLTTSSEGDAIVVK